jgi:hypothetical protein
MHLLIFIVLSRVVVANPFLVVVVVVVVLLLLSTAVAVTISSS